MQLVGFQTRLTYSEQKRVFRKIPGLENASFERYGRMHKNTYINAPLILNKFLQSRQNPEIFFAGQISGVEGYVESIATGLYAGIMIPRILRGQSLKAPPHDTALGSLIDYISSADWKNFKPTKFTFGLLPAVFGKRLSKRNRKEKKGERALNSMIEWKKSLHS
jgi:methylenetetrahydrofolate--tRNA-(uracil-5-)-methyltransferase